MKETLTDLKLLNAIYEHYYDKFAKHSKEERLRETKIYIPIDCAEIAKQFGVDADIIFGRLYYHLENKYGYTQENGSRVHFFLLRADEDRHYVNFPYLASVLATLKSEHRKFNITTIIAILGALAALGVVFVSAVTAKKAAESARSANESVIILKRSFEVENRPYLYIKCAAPSDISEDCKGSTGFWYEFNQGCITRMSWAYINIGKLPAKIVEARLTSTLFDDKRNLITGKRVDVFPNKNLTQTLSGKFCQLPKEWHSIVEITYTASTGIEDDAHLENQDREYTYILKLKSYVLGNKIITDIIEEH